MASSAWKMNRGPPVVPSGLAPSLVLQGYKDGLECTQLQSWSQMSSVWVVLLSLERSPEDATGLPGPNTQGDSLR